MEALRRSAAAAAPARLLPQRGGAAAAAVPVKGKKGQSKGLRESEGPPKHLVRYLPFVPASLVQETTSFLHDSSKLRALLQLIFSPSEQQQEVPEKDRAEYQRALERYLLIREVHTGFYRRHESAAAAAMWKAIEALPSDLYEEAVQAVTYVPSEAASALSSSSALPASSEGAAAAGFPSSSALSEEAEAAAGGSEDDDEGERAEEKQKKKTQQTEKKEAGNVCVREAYSFPRALMFHELYKDQIFASLSSFERRKLQVYMNLMHLRYPHAELKKEKPALFWLPEKQVLTRQREGARKGRRSQK